MIWLCLLVLVPFFFVCLFFLPAGSVYQTCITGSLLLFYGVFIFKLVLRICLYSSCTTLNLVNRTRTEFQSTDRLKLWKITRSVFFLKGGGINILCFCLVRIIFSIQPTSAALIWLLMNRASVSRTVELSQGVGPFLPPHQAALKFGVERKCVRQVQFVVGCPSSLIWESSRLKQLTKTVSIERSKTMNQKLPITMSPCPGLTCTPYTTCQTLTPPYAHLEHPAALLSTLINQ